MIPFQFALERLSPRSPHVRPMFGCYAVYIEEKMVVILRKRKDHPSDNGVWLATSRQHHAELKKLFPALRSIRLLGSKDTEWQNIPASVESFEECVMAACDMILRGDPRIGRITKDPKRKAARKH